MLYRNKETGAVISVQCECGGKWERIDAPAAATAAKKPEEQPAKKTTKRTTKK